MSPSTPPRLCMRCGGIHAARVVCPRAVAAERQRQAAYDQTRASGWVRYPVEWWPIRGRYIREHPLCELCGYPATDVDHRDGDRTHHAEANLRALCHSCHSRRTARDQGFGKAKRRNKTWQS